MRSSTAIKDENSFVFNLESNGRHKGPMKFDILKEKSDRAFTLYPDYHDRLFHCGWDEIVIFKQNCKSYSNCWQGEYSCFDYQGVKKALIKNPKKVWNDHDKDFTTKRIIVIQMK